VPDAPLISVIIPVYDVEEYLPGCLGSVLGQQGMGQEGLSQPGPGIEVIAVDDASPDRCGQILDAAAAADSRLRVVHLSENQGQGHARNAGLELASGEYAWFVDGDDELAPGALAAMARRLAGRPDLLLIGWEGVYPDRTEPGYGGDLLAAVPAGGCTLTDLPRLVELTMTSWSKLLRRDFLGKLGVSFAAGIHEDIQVSCAALLAAQSIEAVAAPCYRYRRDRGGSAMATAGAGHLAIFDSYARVFDLVAQRQAAGIAVSDAVQAALFERAIWHYSTVLESRTAAGRLVPRRERRAFFARMHADFTARRPPGYAAPPGARGLKFRLVERGWYPAYALAEPLNQLRVRLAALRMR
jgi:CDP-glycerol glycerophosphotransferase